MSLEPPVTDVLLTRLRAGDVAAFESLFRTHAKDAFRFALSLVRDYDQAEDLVQDIFGWIWFNHQHFAPANDFRIYLLGAIRNRALNVGRDAQRQTGKMNALEASGRSPTMGEIMPAPDRAVQQAELRSIVWQVAAELSEQRRTVLILRWYYALEWPEVAAVMETSVNAAQVHHTRALADLRKRLPGWLRGEQRGV